jgi:hypothetical protein
MRQMIQIPKGRLVITEVDLFGLQQTPDMHRKFTGVSADLAYTMVQYLE